MNRRAMLKGVAGAGLVGGGVTGTASAAQDREITFCASGEETFRYQIEVDGNIRSGGTFQSDSGDRIEGNSLSGATSQGRCDSFLIRGDIVDRDFSGSGTVTVDGRVERYLAGKRVDDPEFREISFCASGSGTFSYFVKVDGDIQRGGTYESDTGDRIDGSSVRGAVSQGRCDSFLIRGEIIDRNFIGRGTVVVDMG